MADFKKLLEEKLMKGAIPQPPPITKDLGPYSQGAPEEADLPYDENDLMKGAIPEGKSAPESKNPLPSEMPKAEEDNSNDEGDDSSDEEDDSNDEESAAAPTVASASKDAPAAEPSVPQEAPKPGTPAYYSDLMNRFKAAQEQSDVNRNLNDVGKYANAATLGMRGVQRNPIIEKTMEEEGKRADLPVQEFMQQFQLEGQDPNSEAANSMRTVYAQALGLDPSKLANLNIQQMEKSTGFLGTMANKKLMMQAATVANQIKQQRANQDAQKNQEMVRHHDMQNNASLLRTNALKEHQVTAQTDKQNASDEKEIAKGMKEANGLSQSSRSVIGGAERIKAGGQRLLSIVDDPGATPQDMQSAYADMNNMISGATTVSGTEHVAYNNLATTYANLVQKITSSPSSPEIPEIKQHMKDVAKKIMALSDKIQEKQLHKVYLGRRDIYDRHPQARQDLIDSVKEVPDAIPGTQTAGAYDGSTKLANPTPEQAQMRIKYLQNKAGQ